MTTTIERPIVDQIVASTSSSDLSRALRPRLDRLLKLDHNSWMDQLAADGFGPQDIEKLEDLVAASINVVHLEDLLAKTLKETSDCGNESELTAIFKEWSGQIGWAELWRKACRSGFPDPIDAIAFVTRTIFTITSSALAFESIKRNPPEEANLDLNLDSTTVEEGIELAEMGIQEDMATWPAY